MKRTRSLCEAATRISPPPTLTTVPGDLGVGFTPSVVNPTRAFVYNIHGHLKVLTLIEGKWSLSPATNNSLTDSCFTFTTRADKESTDDEDDEEGPEEAVWEVGSVFEVPSDAKSLFLRGLTVDSSGDMFSCFSTHYNAIFRGMADGLVATSAFQVLRNGKPASIQSAMMLADGEFIVMTMDRTVTLTINPIDSKVSPLRFKDVEMSHWKKMIRGRHFLHVIAMDKWVTFNYSGGLVNVTDMSSFKPSFYTSYQCSNRDGGLLVLMCSHSNPEEQSLYYTSDADSMPSACGECDVLELKSAISSMDSILLGDGTLRVFFILSKDGSVAIVDYPITKPGKRARVS